METVTNALRIDDYIKRNLAEAHAPGGSIIEAANTAVRHGFKVCANKRYSDFLEAFRSSPHLSKRYAERYPACCFLPWAAFHNVRNALKLWCDLPEFYAGAIPPEQIPWLDLFELEKDDGAFVNDAAQLISVTEDQFPDFLEICEPQPYRDSFPDMPRRTTLLSSIGFSRQGLSNARRDAAPYFKSFINSFFVLAPPEAFTSSEDFITRFQRLVTDAATRKTEPPNDPLVIRFVYGGCLVVAAWGDEAAELNQRVQALGI